MLICLHDWTCPKGRNGIAVSAIEEYCTYDEEEEDEEVEKSLTITTIVLTVVVMNRMSGCILDL